ncbi:MAG TPA: ornithine cyclodeaminase family protein [Casimicrobiaceae bacterium]|nr:ornithine cyclodeaminase family protein [Casimicrobiaceae bacterium]
MVMLLDEADVRTALRYEALIPAMEQALAALSTGQVIQPVREWLTLEPNERYWGVMPAASDAAMGVKLVSLYPRNAGTGVATVLALIVLVRPDTGEPIAVMDGKTITAMRTAAASAAVTRYLAAPDARVLALLGSGVEAASHLEALSHVRSFQEVRVWSRTREHAERFAARHGAIATDAERAVRDADVIVTATPAREPILKGAWLKPGAHVNAIGAPMPSWRELDDEAMQNIVVVDSREAVLEESGDIILSRAKIEAEAGEVFAGRRRIDASRTTIFKSVGVAVEDVYAAKLAFDAVSCAKSSSTKEVP